LAQCRTRPSALDGRECTRLLVVVVPCVKIGNSQGMVIVAPLTSTRRQWPTRIAVTFAKKSGDIALDQLRCVDRSRLVKRAGAVQKKGRRRLVRSSGRNVPVCG
jgi:mRNA-degrading endonuclease toxin of MazEF toxin-antitoxin module